MRVEHEFVIYAASVMVLSGVLFGLKQWLTYIPEIFITLTLWVGFGLLLIEGVLQLLARVRKFWKT